MIFVMPYSVAKTRSTLVSIHIMLLIDFTSNPVVLVINLGTIMLIAMLNNLVDTVAQQITNPTNV